jgi:hypothetical protein
LGFAARFVTAEPEERLMNAVKGAGFVSVDVFSHADEGFWSQTEFGELGDAIVRGRESAVNTTEVFHKLFLQLFARNKLTVI